MSESGPEIKQENPPVTTLSSATRAFIASEFKNTLVNSVAVQTCYDGMTTLELYLPMLQNAKKLQNLWGAMHPHAPDLFKFTPGANDTAEAAFHFVDYAPENKIAELLTAAGSALKVITIHEEDHIAAMTAGTEARLSPGAQRYRDVQTEMETALAHMRCNKTTEAHR